MADDIKPPSGLTLDDPSPPSGLELDQKVTPPPGLSLDGGGKPSPAGSFIRHAAAGALPALGGWAGFAAGAPAGMAIGALAGPLDWLTIPAGGLIGGVAGAMGAGYATSKAQEAAISALPESTQEAIGQSAAQRKADVETNPKSSFFGDIAPNLAFLRPSLSTAPIAADAGAVGKIFGSPVGSRVAGAGAMGALEAGQEKARGEDLDWSKIGISGAVGALSNKPTGLAEAVSRPIQAGANRIAELTGIPNPSPPPPPAGGLAAGQKRPANLPAITEEAPEGAPAAKSVVGYPFGTEPERVTVLGYLPDGKGVAVQREGQGPDQPTYLSTSDFVKRQTAPPAAEDVTRTEPRRIEGNLIDLEDIDKFGGDTDTTAIRARAAGTTPDKVRAADRQAADDRAQDLLPNTQRQALELAAVAERQGNALMEAGRLQEASAKLGLAQHLRSQYGDPGQSYGPTYTPEQLRNAAEAREAAGQQEVLGQRVPATDRTAASPDTAAAMEEQAKVIKQTGRPDETTEVLGQKAPPSSRAPATAEEAAAMEESARVARETGQAPAGTTELMGQQTEAANRAGASPEDAAEMEAASKAAREAGVQITTDIFGTPVGPIPNVPLALTSEELSYLRGIQGNRKPGQGALDLSGEASKYGVTLTPELAKFLAEYQVEKAQAAQARNPQASQGALSITAPADFSPAAQAKPRGRPTIASQYPMEEVPPEPQRLIDWIRENGGVKDVGGDLRRGLGGDGTGRVRGRIGAGGLQDPIINNETGMSLDRVATAAQEMGYLPEAFSASTSERANNRSAITRAGADESPDLVNPLIEAITNDYNGNSPRYSQQDSLALEEYNAALARNSEIDELSSRYGINLKGLTRDQFFQEVDRRIDAEERNALAEQEARGTIEDIKSAQEEYPEVFEDFQAPSLEDLEREWNAAEPPDHLVSGETGNEPGGPAAGREGPIQENTGQGELAVGAEPEGRVEPTTEPTTAAENILNELTNKPRAGWEKNGFEDGLNDNYRAPGGGNLSVRDTYMMGYRDGEEARLIRENSEQQRLAPEDRTVDQTDQGAQPVLPGAERATPEEVEQQRAARQKQEDELRAKTFRLDQPAAEPDEIPMTDEELGEATQYDPELVRDFFEQFPKTVRGANEGARGWVITRGVADHNEHGVAVDPKTGEIKFVGTNGREDSVGIPEDIATSDTSVDFHHNHPDDLPLSKTDFLALVWRGIGKVIAHTHWGDTFSAELPEAVKNWVQRHPDAESGAQFVMDKLWRSASAIVAKRLDTLIAQGKLHPEDGFALGHDLVLRSLDGAGLIDYVSTRPPTLDPAILNQTLFNAGESVAAKSRLVGLKLNYGEALRDRISDRSTGTLLPDEALDRISGQNEVAPGPGQLRGENGDLGRTGGTQAPQRGEQALVAARPRLAEESELNPEKKPYTPPGTDYIDNVSHEINSASESAGTYARSELNAQRGASGQQGFRFNFINSAFTTMRGLARRDWRSNQMRQAIEARDNEAGTLRNSYRDMLPTFLDANADELAKVNQVREWRRLKGEVSPTDGRDSIMVNDGSVPTALSNPGDIVHLDGRTAKIDQELTQAFHKSWDDVMSASAKKFGWEGEASSQAVQEAIPNAKSPRERKELERTAALMSIMEDQRRSGYSPLMRFGDYYFAITPKAGTEAAKNSNWDGNGFPPVANFQLMDSLTPWEKAKGGKYVEGQTPAEAQKRLEQLQQKFPEDQYRIEHGQLWSKENTLRDLNIADVEKLLMLVGNDVKQQIRDQAKTSSDPKMMKKLGEQVEDLYDRIRGGILDQTYAGMKAGVKKQARNTPGYDPDLTRSSAVYLNWAANHSANLLHNDNIDNVYQNVIAKHPDPQVQQWWEDWQNRNNKERTALDTGLSKARQVAFYWALGANAATTAKILTHGPLLGVPTLSTGLGAAGRAMAVGSYIKAMTQVLSGIRADSQKGLNLDWRNIKGITPEERTMLTNLENENRLHAQNADDMRAIQQSGEDALTPQAKFNRRVLNVWASNVTVADQMTRAGMALAAFRTAKDPAALANMTKSWSRDQIFKDMADANKGGMPTPTDVARFMVDRTAGVTGDANRMPIMRSRVGVMTGQMRNYELNYLSTVNQLMRDMGPEGKVSGALMMGGLAGIVGAGGIPFAKDAYKLFSTIAPQWSQDLEQAMGATGQDNTVAETFLHGMTRNWLGIDLGQGLGFGDLISRQAEGGLNLAGPAAGILGGGAYRAWQRANNGQPPEAWFNELLPNAVKHVVQAYAVEPEQGIVSARSGATVVTPKDITPGMQLTTAAGFQPTKVAKEYEKDNEVYQKRAAKTANVGALENRTMTLLSRAMAMEATDPQGAKLLQNQVQAEVNKAISAGTLSPDEGKKFINAVHQRIIGSQNPDIRRVKELPKSDRGQYLQEHPLQPRQ